MSTVAFIKNMIDLGFSAEDAIHAAEAYEATAVSAPRSRSKAADRQARYEERKRQKTSENVRPDVSDVTDAADASLPLPPSPQTPQPPTPSREYYPPLPPKAGSRRKPSRTIPDGFPAAEDIAEQQAKARSAGANLDVSAQAERFRNHAAQNDRRCADWRAAWRNWIAGAIERAPKTALAASQSRSAPSDADRWRRWLREFRQNGHWPSDDAGPRPGHPACRVPPALLAEFGHAPASAANDHKPDLFAQGDAA